MNFGAFHLPTAVVVVLVVVVLWAIAHFVLHLI